MNIKKVNTAIQRLEELGLCIKSQELNPTIEDGNIILGIICDEVEG